MTIKEKINYVKSRKQIIDMMEELYKLGREGKMDLTRVLVMTDVLNWVVEEDDTYLEQAIKDCEKFNDNIS